jgi:hypothetical protein
MIKKLKAYDEYPTAPLTTVLDSEWDVLSALHRALQWPTKYAKISLDAYLNSEADELATTTELNILQEKPIVPLDPKMLSCNFHIDGRTITRNFKKSIWQTIQLKLLLQQIRLE